MAQLHGTFETPALAAALSEPSARRSLAPGFASSNSVTMRGASGQPPVLDTSPSPQSIEVRVGWIPCSDRNMLVTSSPELIRLLRSGARESIQPPFCGDKRELSDRKWDPRRSLVGVGPDHREVRRQRGYDECCARQLLA